MAVLPLAIAGLSGLGSAALRYGGLRQQAKAMFTEEDQAELARLQGGDLGLSPAQRASMQAQHAAMRGGAMADSQQRQLQQAQSMAGSGAISARDLFLNDLATQQAQGQMLNQQTQTIRDANEAEIAKEEAEQARLLKARADSEALKRGGAFNLGADAVSLAAQTGLAAYGQKSMTEASNKFLEAAAGQDRAAMQAAAMQAANAQMGLQLAGAYGGAAPVLPSYYESALDPAAGAGYPATPLPSPVLPDLDYESISQNYWRGY